MPTYSKILLKLFIFIAPIVVLGHQVLASSCVKIINEKPLSLDSFPQVKSELKAVGEVSSRVARVGAVREHPNKSDYIFNGEGVWEVKTSLINFLHPIPNPNRYMPNPKGFEDQLAQNIQKYGFQLGSSPSEGNPILVAIMPDGKLYCIGGNHRLYAMNKLGENYIPAQVFIWDKLESIEQSPFVDYMPQYK